MTATTPPRSPLDVLAQDLGGDRQPRGPVYSHGAMGDRTFGPGTCSETLRLDPWLCERDGRPTMGSIVMLADSVTGWAMLTALPAELMMVTAQIRVELFRPWPPSIAAVRASATVRHADADVGFTVADLTTDAGPLGMSTMRSAHVPPGAYGRVDEGPSPLADGCVDDVLETECVALTGGTAHIRGRALRALANPTGNLHGGALTMLAERAIVAVASRTDDEASLRPLDIDVSFPRPLTADDSMVDASARVVSRSRRFVQFAAEVARPDGRPAVTVRATYARTGV